MDNTVPASQRLQGQSNYISWCRDFAQACKEKGVWDYLQGRQRLQDERPKLRDYILESNKSRTPSQALPESLTPPAKDVVYPDLDSRFGKLSTEAKSPSTFGVLDEDTADTEERIDPADTTATIASEVANQSARQIGFLCHQHDHAQWITDRKIKSKARALIHAWVSPTIALIIRGKDDPTKAYNYIVDKYRVPDTIARLSLIKEFRNTTLAALKYNTEEYVSTLIRIQTDCKEYGRLITDDEICEQILSGLPPSYESFCDHYNWLLRSQGTPDQHDMEALISELLKEGNKRAERAKKKRSQGNKEQGNNKKSKSTENNITCSNCKKKGHDEQTCWFAHPELRPDNKDKKTNNSKPNKSKANKNEKVAGLVVLEEPTDVDSGKHSHRDPTRPEADTHQQTTDSKCSDGKGWLGQMEEGAVSYIEVNHTKALAAVVNNNNHKADSWLVDSGCNVHIVNDKKWFVILDETPQRTVGTVDGKISLPIEGCGRALVECISPKGTKVKILLPNALYAPTGRCNLIALSKLLEQRELRQSADHTGMTFTKNDKIWGFAKEDNGLYHLDVGESTLSPTGPQANTILDLEHPVWRWHRRLGHLSLQNMRLLTKYADGIDITDQQIKNKLGAICPICATTRAVNKIPRDPAKRRSQRPGDLMHADTWGKYPIEGWDGTFYFLFITDDATRYTWCKRYSRKADLPEKFRELHNEIQRSQDITIRNYRFDNELKIGPIGKWLTKHGVGMEPTQPYMHYQNGTAERPNRTMRDKSAPMLQEDEVISRLTNITIGRTRETLRETKRPENLWPEAVEHAIWLKNRSPTRALKKHDKKTPWEALTNYRPSLEREKIWGSRAYVTIPPEKRMGQAKLHSPRGWLGYWVGRHSESIDKIYSPEKHKVYKVGVSRVEDGRGLDDPSSEPAYTDRVPTGPFDGHEGDHDEMETDEPSDIDEINLPNQEDIGITNDDNEQNNDNDNTPEPVNTEISYGNGELADTGTTKSRFFAGLIDDDDEGRPGAKELSDAASQLDRGSSSDSDNRPRRYVRKNKRPAPWKCDHCFNQRYCCDRDEVGTPCTRCRQHKATCRDQTEETKKKILKFGHQQLLNKGSDRGTKCRGCYIAGRRCVFLDADSVKCEVCKARSVTCNMDLTGAVSAAERIAAQSKKTSTQPKGVLRNKKCTRCAKNNLRCNGLFPCNRCQTPRLQHSCRPQQSEGAEAPKCMGCTGGMFQCNKNRPCSMCQRRKVVCSYREQDGLVIRSYGAVERPTVMAQNSDECSNCIKRKRNCNGGEPCYQCIKEWTKIQTGEIKHRQRSNCSYYKGGQHTEKWSLVPWHLDDVGAPALKDNWQEIIQDDHKKYETRNRSSKAPTTGNSNPSATTELHKAFPCGYEVLQTPTAGYLCGLHAAILSMAHQLPSLPRPTVEQLQAMMQHPELAVLLSDAEVTNRNNLTADQIAGLLYFWSRELGLRLQLAYVAEGMEPLLVPVADGQGEHHIVWIHNDNAQGQTRTRLKSGSHILNHWSGMKPCTQSETSASQRGKHNEVQSSLPSSDTDDGPDNENNRLDGHSDIDDDIGAFCGAVIDSGTQHREHSSVRPIPKYLPDPQNYSEMLRAPDRDQFLVAKADEIKSLEENHTYDIVDVSEVPDGVKPITSRFAWKRKYNEHGHINRYKARLVARGFQQEEGVDYDETYSAVVKPTSFRILFALAAIFGWKIHQMDVKTAFLNGLLDRYIYMKPPRGMKLPKGKILRLLRALYGLKQAPRTWWDEFTKTMILWGWRVSAFDPCVFIRDEERLIVCLWVDDILIFGLDLQVIQGFKDKLSQKFSMTDEGECKYYLGLHVEQSPGKLRLHQKQYIDMMLHRYNYENIKTTHTPGDSTAKLCKNTGEVDAASQLDYQSKVGSLNYLCNMTRPDTAFTTGCAARYASNPGQQHHDSVSRIFQYLKRTKDMGITYDGTAGAELKCFVDSDFGNCEDTRKSTTGYIFMLAGAPIDWRSKRQTTVALSTMDAEYIACATAAAMAIWIRNFMNDLRLPDVSITHVPMYIDNNAALKLTRNPEFHDKSKHIAIKYHFIREKVMKDKVISTHRVGTKDNLADILTKALPRVTHENLVQKIGIQGENAAQIPFQRAVQTTVCTDQGESWNL